MSIMLRVDTEDAVVLQAAADMLNTIARSRLGMPPVMVGCGCKNGLDATADALEGVEYKSALGPITAHCLELAKEHNAAVSAALDPAVAALDALTAVDPATVFAQAPLPSEDPNRVVPGLSASYTSPTGQLAPGAAPAPPAASIFPPAATLDKNGLPWDERINTSNKAQTEKGVWKMRKGLPEGVYDRVVAELRTAQGASVAPTPPAPVAAPPAPAAVEPFPGDDMLPGIPPTPQVVPAPPAPVAAPPNVPPAPATDDPAVPQTIAQLIPLVTQAINGGKITLEAVNAIIKDVTGGAIASMPILATRADLIPNVYQHLKNAWSMA